MWRLIDCNKSVGTHLKVRSYKNHISNLKRVKSSIKIEEPWKPTFSLSKRQNKYHKFVQEKITKQNENLLTRMLKIQTEPMRNTINNIPLTIPSNKHTFLELKARQRRAEFDEIKKENNKILDKLTTAGSDYNKRTLSQEWKENKKYRENIIKKQHVPDFGKLAKHQIERCEKSRISRPRTAFTPLSKPLNEQ